MKFNQFLMLNISFVVAACSTLQYPSYESPVAEISALANKTESDYLRPTDDIFELQWPVAKVKITQGFKSNRRKTHDGIDLVHYYGAPIYAAHNGVVIYTGSKYRGYGKMVMIEFDNTWASVYAHLSKIKVYQGQRIKAGEIIGSMGKTGRATGTHLHFELLQNQLPINPLLYLKSPQRFVKN